MPGRSPSTWRKVVTAGAFTVLASAVTSAFVPDQLVRLRMSGFTPR